MKISIPEIKVEFEGVTYGGDKVSISIRLEGGRGVRPPVIVPVGTDPNGAIVDMMGESELYGECRSKLERVREELKKINELIKK